MQDATDNRKLIRRLQIAEGQVRGIRRMIERDAEPVHILTQMAAARAAIAKAATLVIKSHLRTSVADLMERGGSADELDKVVDSLGDFNT